MPYLAKIPLNPLRSHTRSLLTNPQRMHAAVEGSLPPKRSGRLLWRLERTGVEASLLVQSPDWPNFEHLIEQAGWPGNREGQARIADLSSVLNLIAVGREFHFRTRLNTVSASRTIAHPTANQSARMQSGKQLRLGQRTPARQLEWFLSRAAGDKQQWGFSVGGPGDETSAHLVGREQVRFRRAAGAPVTLDVGTFEGTLTVTDADRLRECLVNGIGKGKAYGCGLLTLAPPNSDG